MLSFVLFRVISWFQFPVDDWNHELTRNDTNDFLPRRISRLGLAIFLLQLSASAQNLTRADIVIVNANIRAMASPNSRATALAVTGNRISAVGTNERIRKLVGPKTRVIDAGGRLVLPGFNDAHVHFMGVGNSFSSLNLRDVRTAEEFLDVLSRYARFLPRGRWILGGSWNDAFKLPDRETIDAATAHHPVFLYHADGASAIVNSPALSAAKLKNHPPDAATVTGNALAVVRGRVPQDHTRNRIEIAETATVYAASLGVTSVHDVHTDDNRDVYTELQRLGKLTTRIYECIGLPDWQKIAKETRQRNSDAMVRGGCLKSFSDGDEGSAARLLRDVVPADNAGLQIMIHAIGNSANNIVLGVFEETTKRNGRRDRRFRVEHAHNPSLDDLPRFVKSDIIASMQPHLFNGGNGGFYRTLLKQRSMIAFGSDAAITDFDPILGIHAAVNAGTESISVYEAVRSYTVGSAYAEFQETQKGTIEVGRLADLVILSENIFVVEPMKIRDARVDMTIVDGRVVFGRESANL